MHPKALRDYFSDNDGYIKSSLGNFGHIQYGSSILGQIVYPKSNKNGCHPFKDDDFKQLSDHSNEDHSQMKPIIIIDRGECTFVKKVKNIEDYGIKLAIIVDDRDEYSENLIMADDGNGHGINIPSFIINKKDGDKIKEYLLKNDSNSNNIVIKAELEIAHPSNLVKYELFYSSVLDIEHYFIEDLIRYQQAFGNNVIFTPRIASFQCKDCPKIIYDSDCIYDGMYCPLQSFTDISMQLMLVPRTQLIQQSLRERCLFDTLNKKFSLEDNNENHQQQTSDNSKATIAFLQYLLAFQDLCLSKEVFGENCSLEAMQQIGLSASWVGDIADCIKQTTATVDLFGKQVTINTLLSEDRKRKEDLGLVLNPGIVINNMTYRGDIEAKDVFQAICAGYATKPDICKGQNFANIDDNMFSNPNQQAITEHSEDFIKMIHVYIMVILVLVINLGLLCAYRYYHRKKVRAHMTMHVNSAVSQYFKISGKDDSFSGL